MKYIDLNNGLKIPAVGLGTYPMNGFTLIKTLIMATRFGYTSFDTSEAYKNEKAVGHAIKICGKKRKDIIITTKLSNTQQRSGDIKGAVENSLELLQTKYIDLYLMHWPNPDTYLNSWKQMEKAYKRGVVRAIGVCNFHQHHLQKLLNIADVMPTVNQVEIHPLLSQKPLIEFCENNTIKMEAYSPLARMEKNLINNDGLIKIAEKYNKSVAQVILRWDFQLNTITIPKTQNIQRLKENIDIFDFRLNRNEMESINSLNCGLRVRYDPDNCDFRKL